MIRGLLLIATAGLIPACGSGSGSDAPPPSPQPDFSLIDVNASSPLYTTAVSPRDYLNYVSGWYFGFAT